MSDLPASQSAGLGPSRDDKSIFDKPVRTAIGSFDWLVGMARQNVTNGIEAVARQVHHSAERPW